MAEHDCGNCYDHCSRCFTEPVAPAVAAGDKMPDEAELRKYFDEVTRVEEGDAAPTLQAGDLVRWPGHAGIATGVGDRVSQCGYPIDHWKRVRALEKGAELSESERSAHDKIERGGCVHGEVSAGELTPLICGPKWRADNAGKKCSYVVYRIKEEHKAHLLCTHSKTSVLNLSYGHISMDAYPGGARYTDYELRYTLKQSAPEAKDLGSWTGKFRLDGGHTHYGWTGWATFELPLDVLERLGEAALRAIAESAMTREGH